MKINKLFHWLYALIMLLPIGYIGGFTLYSVFNKNAYLSNSITETQPQVETTIEYQYQYETNVVSSWSDIYVDNVYYMDEFAIGQDGSATYDTLEFNIVILKCSGVSFNSEFDSSSLDDFYFADGFSSPFYLGVYLYYDSGLIDVCYASYSFGDAYFGYIYNFDGSTNYFTGVVFSDCYFYISDGTESFVSYCTDIDNPLSLPQESDYLGNIVSATATSEIIPGEPGTLDNAFNYALENLNNLPFFAWSQNTFFSAPFNYIANLFGIASSNPICSLLSYWFSISVIWLVFDVMLYVPLLVHRWLDKASLS